MRGSSNAPKIVHSNKNLLDNWDFTNPVNQRGQSAYANTEYTIDRWALNAPSSMLSLQKNSIKLSCKNTQYGGIYQIIPLKYVEPGTKITVSTLYKTKTLGWYTHIWLRKDEGRPFNIVDNANSITGNNILTTAVLEMSDGLYDGELSLLLQIVSDSKNTQDCEIKAVKVEYGEVSTLKNDALGVSYAEELRKCQRYYYDSRTESTISDGRIRMKAVNENDIYVTGNVFFPVQMRAKPVITIYSEQGNVGNLNNGINGEELTGLGAYTNFYGRDCFSQVNLNKPLSQVTTVKEVCFHYTASAEL